MKTFTSKLLDNKFSSVFVLLFIIFSSLFFISGFKIIFCAFAVISLLGFIKSYCWIATAMLIIILAILILKLTDGKGLSLGEKPSIRSGGIKGAAARYFSSGSSTYKKYASLMFLGIKTSDAKEIYNISVQINVVHLFVISGFHISLFHMIVTYVQKKLKVNENYAPWISLIPITFYVYLLGFPISATRAYFFSFGGVINKTILKKKYSNIEVLTVVAIGMILINPNNITSLSYILTFMATYAILLLNEIKYKSKTRKVIWVSLGVYISTFPVLLYTNNFVLVFGLFFGYILTPIFVVIYTMTLFLFWFKPFMNYVYVFFDFILRAINEINVVIPVNFVNKTITQYYFLSIETLFIIYKLWNSSMVKKIT